jgi:hypothetical protein
MRATFPAYLANRRRPTGHNPRPQSSRAGRLQELQQRIRPLSDSPYVHWRPTHSRPESDTAALYWRLKGAERSPTSGPEGTEVTGSDESPCPNATCTTRMSPGRVIGVRTVVRLVKHTVVERGLGEQRNVSCQLNWVVNSWHLCAVTTHPELNPRYTVHTGYSTLDAWLRSNPWGTVTSHP